MNVTERGNGSSGWTEIRSGPAVVRAYKDGSIRLLPSAFTDDDLPHVIRCLTRAQREYSKEGPMITAWLAGSSETQQ